ncbi:MAG TPA: protein-disulfide reductase DsbD domain-containing protein [Vicinamibacteria bacterium]|nr:protein-disulfide reductase DsbD domain-containing protein [Vicinamibacteria bacterium]
MIPTRGRGLVSSLLALALCLAATAAMPQARPARHTKASLVSETDAIQPGRTLRVGIRLEMEEGWHTYWRNPGDSGLPTRARWELPAGFAAGEMRWPYPTRFRTGPLVSYGYERDVLLPVEIRVPPAPSAGEARIAVRVDWLECQDACLPGRADLSLDLPVRPVSAPGPQAGLFTEARRRLPTREPGWTFAVAPAPSALRLLVRTPRGTALQEAYFYPSTPRLLDHGKPQPLTREGATHRLELPRDPNGAPAERLAGVLVAETGRGTVAVEVDAPIAAGPARTSQTQE